MANANKMLPPRKAPAVNSTSLRSILLYTSLKNVKGTFTLSFQISDGGEKIPIDLSLWKKLKKFWISGADPKVLIYPLQSQFVKSYILKQK